MSIRVRTYADAASFLRHARLELESNEAANSLMLGVCERLVRHPERIEADPCLKTVEDETGLVLAAMMTPPHKLVVSGHRVDLEQGIRVLVSNLADEGCQVPGVMGPSEFAQRVAEELGAASGRGYELDGRQTLYELRKVLNPPPSRGKLRLAIEADVELVARWWHTFHQGIFGTADRVVFQRSAEMRIGDGDIYLWEDGPPVSMAMKNRPTSKGISIGLVYTPPEVRRRGYATACVGELSRVLLGEGWAFCSLFTGVENVAARRVYHKVGYRALGDYDEYLFDPPSEMG